MGLTFVLYQSIEVFMDGVVLAERCGHGFRRRIENSPAHGVVTVARHTHGRNRVDE